MLRINSFFFTIIQFILLLDNAKQSHVRLKVATLKVFGKTIKSPLVKKFISATRNPIVKTFGNTIKKTAGMFRRNKNTIKNISFNLQAKYSKIHLNFGSRSMKLLGKEGIKKVRCMTPQAASGSKQLFRTESKRNIQTRSAEQMKRKNISSLINMVSESKPQLPFLFAAGGLNRITQFNLAKNDGNSKTLASQGQYKELLKKNKIKVVSTESKSSKVLKAEEIELLKNFQAYKHTERTSEEKALYYGVEPNSDLYYKKYVYKKGETRFFSDYITPHNFKFGKVTIKTDAEKIPDVKITYLSSDECRKDAWYAKNLILNSYPNSKFEFIEEAGVTDKFVVNIDKKVVWDKKDENGVSFREDINGLMKKVKKIAEAK